MMQGHHRFPVIGVAWNHGESFFLHLILWHTNCIEMRKNISKQLYSNFFCFLFFGLDSNIGLKHVEFFA